jgi:HK97 family phage major capsid protein
MKMTLKKFRKIVSDLKAAWLAAKKGADADATQKALAAYQAKNALLDGFDADGKKDDEDVELPAEKPVDQNVVEFHELKSMISGVVEAQIKAAIEGLPTDKQPQVTPEQIKDIVEKALEAQAKGKAVKVEDIKGIVTAATQEAIANLKLPSKIQHDKDAEHKGGGGKIEIPCSQSQGNLPLHMKQLLNVLMKREQDHGIDASDLKKGKAIGDKQWWDMKAMGAKALTTTGDGTGSEWIPRDLSSELERRLYLESALAMEFLSNEINMPTDTYDNPLLTTRPIFKRAAGQTVPPAASSNPGSSRWTLTTEELVALVQYSYRIDEDSIVPILPTLQAELGAAAADALETAILNGDTTGTHQDSDITDSLDAAKSWKGFRKLALAVTELKSDLTTGNLSRANLNGMIRKMGKWGARPSELLWIVGTSGWSQLNNLDEVVFANYRGSVGAYITGGATPAPWGGTIILSERQREDLNASGVYDGVTLTKGAIIAVNRKGFKMGTRREFTVETDKDIKARTHDVVASFRKAFTPVETPSATIKTVVIGYNWAS